MQTRVHGAELTEPAGLFASGRLSLRVAETFPFERVAEAHTMPAKDRIRDRLDVPGRPHFTSSPRGRYASDRQRPNAWSGDGSYPGRYRVPVSSGAEVNASM
ncbi:hypothetical protein [Streptomyces sp. NPDC088350]|uniref:hypothetical protein n=1 Tax=Streptomyces sp. NPDC088350 TaxID=3365854 RepID=UPI0037F58A93